MAGDICHRPTWVDLKGKDSVPESVNHFAVIIGPSHKSYEEAWQNELCASCTDRVHCQDSMFSETAPDKSLLSISEGI